MAEQMTLFHPAPLAPAEEPRGPEEAEPTITEPVREGEHMSIHGLVYSLEPVDGWLAVKRLAIFRPPVKHLIADLAWVHSDTVRWACRQDYDGKWSPIAWGFGPEIKITRHQQEMASFFFVDPADYNWIGEILAVKRAEHNRLFDEKREERLNAVCGKRNVYDDR